MVMPLRKATFHSSRCLICQARQLVDLRNVADWLSVDVLPGDPLAPHVLGRVPKLKWDRRLG